MTYTTMPGRTSIHTFNLDLDITGFHRMRRFITGLEEFHLDRLVLRYICFPEELIILIIQRSGIRDFLRQKYPLPQLVQKVTFYHAHLFFFA